jgi:hypothetical protein
VKRSVPAEKDQRSRILVDLHNAVILAFDDRPRYRAPFLTAAPNPRRDLKHTARFGSLKQQRGNPIVGVEVPAESVAFLRDMRQARQHRVGAAMVSLLTEQPADKGSHGIALEEPAQKRGGSEAIIGNRGVSLNVAFRELVCPGVVLALSRRLRAIVIASLRQECFELSEHDAERIGANEIRCQEDAPLRKLIASLLNETLKNRTVRIENGVAIQINDRSDGPASWLHP